MPTSSPDNEGGVTIDLASDTKRDEFLKQVEEHFAARRFTNTADAFDTVKACVIEHVANR